MTVSGNNIAVRRLKKRQQQHHNQNQNQHQQQWKTDPFLPGTQLSQQEDTSHQEIGSLLGEFLDNEWKVRSCASR